MSNVVAIDNQQVLMGLGRYRAAISDKGALLGICGEIMRASVTRTFRDEGSPAGSWPELAASTRKDKLYTAGHKLLILSGRLFDSITYLVSENILTIGTDVVYAAVHQWGSKDWMGGAAGPRSFDQMSSIGAYAGFRAGVFRKYGKAQIVDKHGNERTARMRLRGPADSGNRFPVAAHTRRENIPQRMFLLFRPEDPANMATGIEVYLQQKGGLNGVTA